MMDERGLMKTLMEYCILKKNEVAVKYLSSTCGIPIDDIYY